jgi:hypothetical protein
VNVPTQGKRDDHAHGDQDPGPVPGPGTGGRRAGGRGGYRRLFPELDPLECEDEALHALGRTGGAGQVRWRGQPMTDDMRKRLGYIPEDHGQTSFYVVRWDSEGGSGASPVSPASRRHDA